MPKPENPGRGKGQQKQRKVTNYRGAVTEIALPESVSVDGEQVGGGRPEGRLTGVVEFGVTPATHVHLDLDGDGVKEPATLADLAVGDKVFVHARTATGGGHIAQLINERVEEPEEGEG